eukprot:6191794-Pyramimonas_sp.AAC.1
MTGEFFEHFELQNFPYDLQRLTITVRMNSKYDDNLKRYAVHRVPPRIMKEVQLSEWKLYDAEGEVTTDDKGKPVYKVRMRTPS